MRDGFDQHPPRGRSHILRAEQIALQEKASRLLEEARGDAARIRAEAEVEAEARLQRGYEDGYVEGAKAAAALLVEVGMRADAYSRDMAKDLSAIVIVALGRILGAGDRAALACEAVAQALREMRDYEGLRLIASPKLADSLRSMLEGEAVEDEAWRLVRVEAAANMAPGRCRLESPLGSIELDPAAQLEALRTGIRAAHEDN